MVRKILIIATKNWGKAVEQKHIEEAKKIMMSGNAFSDVIIDIEYKKIAKPEMYQDKEGNNRITQDWFEQNISKYGKAKGYDSTRLRIESEEGARWKLESGIRGINYSDKDFHGEGWIVTGARKMAQFNDGTSRLQFPKTLAHEEGHELRLAGITTLEIHDFDFQNKINNIEEFYKRLVEKKATVPELKKTLTGLMLKAVELLHQKLNERAIYPVDVKKNKMTQAWLAPSKLYKSGHHNGLDIACPPRTAIRAPHDGEVYLSGTTPQLGDFVFYECVVRGEKTYHVFPHLIEPAATGTRKKGDTIGLVGSTGLSTGAHMHWTILKVKPVSVSHYVSLVDTKEKIIKNTHDPLEWASYEVDRI